jgi:hypothetical protein
MSTESTAGESTKSKTGWPIDPASPSKYHYVKPSTQDRRGPSFSSIRSNDSLRTHAENPGSNVPSQRSKGPEGSRRGTLYNVFESPSIRSVATKEEKATNQRRATLTEPNIASTALAGACLVEASRQPRKLADIVNAPALAPDQTLRPTSRPGPKKMVTAEDLSFSTSDMRSPTEGIPFRHRRTVADMFASPTGTPPLQLPPGPPGTTAVDRRPSLVAAPQFISDGKLSERSY